MNADAESKILEAIESNDASKCPKNPQVVTFKLLGYVIGAAIVITSLYALRSNEVYASRVEVAELRTQVGSQENRLSRIEEKIDILLER